MVKESPKYDNKVEKMSEKPQKQGEKKIQKENKSKVVKRNL